MIVAQTWIGRQRCLSFVGHSLVSRLESHGVVGIFFEGKAAGRSYAGVAANVDRGDGDCVSAGQSQLGEVEEYSVDTIVRLVAENAGIRAIMHECEDNRGCRRQDLSRRHR